MFKKNDPTLLCNYRPISLLNTLSKVLERCVFNHCYQHLISSLIYNMVSLRVGLQQVSYSTSIIIYWILLLVGQKLAPFISTWLKPSTRFHIISCSWNWKIIELKGLFLLGLLVTFLVDNKVLLWAVSILIGVPQDSILVLLLFLVCINDAPDYIQHNSSIALYADDSKLFRSIKVTTPSCN